MDSAASNRRGGARLRSLKGAKIIINRQSSLDCTVRNLSDTGAKIVVPSPVMIPDRFELRFEDGRELPCIVRWRTLSEFGVEFVQPRGSAD